MDPVTHTDGVTMAFPGTWNADFVDEQYQRWKTDPKSVSSDWRFFFTGFELASARDEEAVVVCDEEQVRRQSRVENLVHRYRDLGHLLACLDPLVACPTDHPLLDLRAFSLTEEDLDREFYTDLFPETGRATLREIVRALRETYCRSIGVEYMHIQDPDERRWLQERIEPGRNRTNLTREERVRILEKLYQANLFEQFLNRRYPGQTRFSLEGAEVVIPTLDALVRHATGQGCREIILGMAHRGRLNVQVNVLEKPYRDVFCEFESSYDPESVVGSGDVKYHNGYFGEIAVGDGEVMRIGLVNNPSHLETVDPVVEGLARARQDLLDDRDGKLVLPLLIHGDAAFAGEGIAAETLNMSQLEGYRTGGTVHIVINNQIGYTTPPKDARSTCYATDIAKMLMVPIFHIHGESPDAALHVVRLACDYRRKFGKDVVIDLVCYRRYGHNEGDEPYFTQPRMYHRIRERPPIHEIYSKTLLEQGAVSPEEVERMRQGVNECLEASYQARECAFPTAKFYEEWEGVSSEYSDEPVDTGVSGERLVTLAGKLNASPEGFSLFGKLTPLFKRRLETVEKGEGIDWANGEILAFASLLTEGTPIRLSGQDSGRGTFSQRHSVLVNTETDERFVPLNAVENGQAVFAVYDSMLSEAGILGFEYGYSLAQPHGLVIWEAQFGDFANNAQSIIDLYIASGESKWRRPSGLVLLLPHGMEGLGPEHSSARLERFLQLGDGENLQVCNPTTPAQYFHLLRRQVKQPFRKPLVVMTPKSLLRHPRAVSKLEDFTSGFFRTLLAEDKTVGPERVLFCSGKIYYELLQRREELRAEDLALVRLEQLHPFPRRELEEVAERYGEAKEWCWVQEEPENMGAWQFVRPRLAGLVHRHIRYIGRRPAATPAPGFHNIYKMQQEAVISEAVGPKP
jgi:2-oxoglutarate dehydrogenase E1 component